MSATSTGRWGTACAPSTSTRAPASFAWRTISRTGVIVPIPFETWGKGAGLGGGGRGVDGPGRVATEDDPAPVRGADEAGGGRAGGLVGGRGLFPGRVDATVHVRRVAAGLGVYNGEGEPGTHGLWR